MSYELFIEYYQQVQEILSNNIFQEYGVIGLFINSLLSATALPIPTEILTSALLMGGESVFLVAAALMIGSTIGGLFNYTIGFGGNKLFNKLRKNKHKKIEHKKGHRLLDKFGWTAIFFASWIPVVGDLILISAGAKKMKFIKYSIFMISGKALKTIIVVIGLGSIL